MRLGIRHLSTRRTRTTAEEAGVSSLALLTGCGAADLTKQASGNHANLDDFDLADELASATDIGVEQGEDNALLMRVVQELGESDQIVIALYYFEGLTLAEIGAVLGVTESRVSQLHSRAAATLRNKILALENV